MNISEPNVTGLLWAVAGCLLLYIGLIVWEAGDYMKKIGAPEKDADIKRLREQLAGLSAGKEELVVKSAEIQRLSAQLKEAQNARSAAESELFAAKRAAENARTELDMLRIKVSGYSEQLAGKDAEIHRLNAQVVDAQGRQEKAKAELDIHKASATGGAEQLAGKDAEIQRLKEQLAGIESDVQGIENEIGLCKRSSHDMKRRLEESRMKMRLLSEKSKENVELIASFADGKEFDEFRKSIHLDEIIQKYEDEIKELRIKNMDLEKTDR